ncbi:unnamed protein product [Chironomus riparius]|uniref:Ionotropic receptor n=1 Tax=Chironomus riparius TaxID=315576 RepID=A0A9N9WYD9_9DIPT|nr:unnamed protein product [Chironomus riparius]
MLNLKQLFVIIWMSFSFNEALRAVLDDIQISVTSNAILEVVDVFYVNQFIPFDIFVFHRDDKDDDSANVGLIDENPSRFPQDPSHFEQVISKFLSKLSKLSYRLSTNQTIYDYKSFHATTKSIIFFLNSCLDYFHIHYEYALFNQYLHPFKFLIYIENCSFFQLFNNIENYIQLKKLFLHKGSLEVFEYLFINDGNFLYLTSLEWFSQGVCNKAHLKLINTFDKSTQKWHKKLKNHKKFQNYYGCDLVMLLYERESSEKLGTFIIDDKSSKIVPFGLTPLIFTLISKKLNFKPYFQPGKLKLKVSVFHSSNEMTLISVNGTIKPPNVCLEVTRFGDLRKLVAHSTTNVLQIREIILVTPGELYLPFEKLFLPFDDWTWQLIVLTFLTAFVAIFVINRLPKIFQITIYGENVTTPVLNVVSSFFGISQVKLPDKNFPRFILIMFVMFCLIFRTCYQSKLFELMTSEPRRAPPKSIEDLVDRNYTMYVPVNFAAGKDLTANEQWPYTKFVDILEYSDIFDTQSQNSSARIAMTMQSMVLDHYEWSTGDSKFWLQIPDTAVQVSHVGFSMFSNNFFMQGLNEVTEHLVMSGIMDKIVRDLMGTKRKFIKGSEPQTLSIENLSFGFIIWMWFCGVCVLVFMLEISVGNFKKLSSYSEVFKVLRDAVVTFADVKRFRRWFEHLKSQKLCRNNDKMRKTVKHAIENVLDIL